MEFLNYLKESTKSAVVTRTKFMQQYRPKDNSIHIFYEGKDDPSFYSNFIEPYKRKYQRIYYYNAHNKTGVYLNHSKLDWSQYEKNRILFFVDKDLSDLLNESFTTDRNIFVTRFYSIENYLVSKTLCARCLRELMGIEDDKLIYKITKEFSHCLYLYHNEIRPIMAMILYYRSIHEPLNLNNLDLSKLFSFKKGIHRIVGITEYFVKNAGLATNMSYTEIKRNLNILLNIANPKVYVRGKFELWFFVYFLNSLPSILNKDKVKGEPRYKLNINLSPSTAVQVLAPRLRIPPELKGFLDANLKKNSVQQQV